MRTFTGIDNSLFVAIVQALRDVSTSHLHNMGPKFQERAPPLKRNASLMEESSDLSQLSPSQKRAKLIEVALAEDRGESSSHSGPFISSPNATNPRNISAPQLSPSVGHAVTFPQTPTRSAKRPAIRSPSASPQPFELRSQQSSTSTAKDDSMAAYPFGSGEMTPELIGNMLNVIPDYIRKVDRKRIAAEKSLDVRNKKIEYLENEVKRLKDRQRELELIIADYESKG